MTVQCVADVKNTLGESCFWEESSRTLFWTDIDGKTLYRRDERGDTVARPLPERCAFFFPRKRGGFILGFEKRIVIADESFSRFETVTPVEEDLPGTRLNDAAVDPFGRLVFGTMNELGGEPVAGIYLLTSEGNLRKFVGNITISNGIAFSPDGGLLYFTDTLEGSIRRLALHGDSRPPEELVPLAPLGIAPGKPDGATVDREGNYWSARVWGGCVACISPDGRLAETIELPVPAPTCVCLGGPDMRTLFITSLRKRHTAEQLERAPLAGGVFAVDAPVPGLRQSFCVL